MNTVLISATRFCLLNKQTNKQTTNSDLLEKAGIGTKNIIANTTINDLAFKVSSVHILTAVITLHFNKLDKTIFILYINYSTLII